MSALADPLLLARVQFAANISFHILFPSINMALAWVLLYFKLRGRADDGAPWHFRHKAAFVFGPDPRTRRGFITPARHFASSDTSSALPPMGMRVRLKASFDPAGVFNRGRLYAAF